MNQELCKEMKAKAEKKSREHQEIYGFTGRYYNRHQMEMFQDLADIYETAMNADAAAKSAVWGLKSNQAVFMSLLRAEIGKLGRMSLADFNEWMYREGRKYL